MSFAYVAIKANANAKICAYKFFEMKAGGLF